MVQALPPNTEWVIPHCMLLRYLVQILNKSFMTRITVISFQVCVAI